MIYLYIIVGIILIVISYIYEYLKKVKKMKENIKESYGKKVNIKKNKTDTKYASNYFKNYKDDMDYYVDDITWNDLSMDEFFLSINNTRTSIGDEFLYSIFRNLCFEVSELKIRDSLIEFFRGNCEDRFKIQLILAKYGKNESANVSFYFKNPKEVPKSRIVLLRFLQIIPFIFMFAAFLLPPLALVALICLGFNMWIHSRLKKYKGYEVDDYMYLLGMTNVARKIYSLNLNEINSKFPNIKENLHNIKHVKNTFIDNSPMETRGETGILSEYMNMFLLKDVIKYEKICKVVMNHPKDFEEIFKYIGLIDSMIAVASYREAVLDCCIPTFVKDNKFKFTEIYHPFINDPITNDCDIKRSILITGSNASGKSTFLKTVALNAITAQSIYTVFAKEYESDFFRVYSSMALKDSIFTKESYYMVEIKSLKRIIDSIEGKFKVLCFVDEILRGTNTVERIAASSEVLNYFSTSNNCICIAATHDIELTHILEKCFDNYHFQEEIESDDIKFDYKIYKGRSETRNAIKILEIIGYENDIVKRAEKLAEDFIETGVWKEF
ncbi:MutS-related protein [Clostridium sp.]|uniref:MutS-related protein n=1 Tax=Clostridium sp. TaxID=1506 RepID=UPI002FCB3CB1